MSPIFENAGHKRHPNAQTCARRARPSHAPSVTVPRPATSSRAAGRSSARPSGGRAGRRGAASATVAAPDRCPPRRPRARPARPTAGVGAARRSEGGGRRRRPRRCRGAAPRPACPRCSATARPPRGRCMRASRALQIQPGDRVGGWGGQAQGQREEPALQLRQPAPRAAVQRRGRKARHSRAADGRPAAARRAVGSKDGAASVQRPRRWAARGGREAVREEPRLGEGELLRTRGKRGWLPARLCLLVVQWSTQRGRGEAACAAASGPAPREEEGGGNGGGGGAVARAAAAGGGNAKRAAHSAMAACVALSTS